MSAKMQLAPGIFVGAERIRRDTKPAPGLCKGGQKWAK